MKNVVKETCGLFFLFFSLDSCLIVDFVFCIVNVFFCLFVYVLSCLFFTFFLYLFIYFSFLTRLTGKIKVNN